MTAKHLNNLGISLAAIALTALFAYGVTHALNTAPQPSATPSYATAQQIIAAKVAKQ